MSHPQAVPSPENGLILAFWRAFPGGAGLALTFGVLVCAQVGCLIPQAVDPKDAGPHPPPHIVVQNIPEDLLSPILTLQKQGTGDAAQIPPCHCVLEFTGISVFEEDATIELLAKWFIDYDANNPARVSQIGAPERLPGDFNDVTKTVRQLSVFRLDADAVNITTSGTHVVEVVVGETTGFDDSPTASQPNRSMKPGWFAAVYKWAVDVHLEQVTGQCTTAPPSKLV